MTGDSRKKLGFAVIVKTKPEKLKQMPGYHQASFFLFKLNFIHSLITSHMCAVHFGHINYPFLSSSSRTPSCYFFPNPNFTSSFVSHLVQSTWGLCAWLSDPDRNHSLEENWLFWIQQPSATEPLQMWIGLSETVSILFWNFHWLDFVWILYRQPQPLWFHKCNVSAASRKH